MTMGDKVSPTWVWYEALLSVRAPTGDHVSVEVEAKTGVKVPWRDDPAERWLSSKYAAEAAFRELGFGQVMDLPDSRWSISTRVA